MYVPFFTIFAITSHFFLSQGIYTWNPSTQGIILGAFYYGYICTPLLGGRLSEMVGAKWLLGGGIFFTSLLTLITPTAADWGVAAMVTLRVIIGAAQVTFFTIQNCHSPKYSSKNNFVNILFTSIQYL